ncbi:MAG: polysaccharide biosynthesis tyrosine autokinase [Microcoleaceae cyanobacterium]
MTVIDNRESLDLDLGRYLRAITRRCLPAISVFILIVGLAAYATRYLKPSYEASGKLLFKVDRTSSLAGIGEELGELRALLADQTPLSTQMELISSNPLLQETIDNLNLINEEGEPLQPEDLRRNLEIKIIGGTDIVQLGYTSPDPQRAADIINMLMNVYIQSNIDNNRDEAAEARLFIVEQLPKVQDEVFQAERALKLFKERNDILDLSAEFQTSVEEQANLNRQITTIESELSGVNALATSLGSRVGLSLEEAIALNTISQSPVVRGTLEQLQQVEGELANERRRFKDLNPRVIALKNKRDSLQAILNNQIAQAIGNRGIISDGLLQIRDQKRNLLEDFIVAETRRLELTRQLDSLYQSQNNYQQRARALPEFEQQQQELERKVEVARVTYETLLKNLEEVQVAENKTTNNTRIIEAAIVPEKGSTGKTKLLALGILVGGFAATSLVVLLEMGDKSLRSLEDMKSIFSYTILGIIPSFSRRSPLWGRKESGPDVPVIYAPESLESEIYRMLQANLKFLSSDKKLKTLVVTSSVPREGKSTVSANLAAAIAQLGYQVLLIDADMRHPCQHHIWGLTNAVGLSDVLVGQAEATTAISQGIEQPDILTAGVTPPNPLALLDSKRMQSLIRSFSETYDFVIIDTPPIIIGADALTLSQMTNGMLLVARPGTVDRDSALVAQETLERSNQQILGMVVNAINKNESMKYFQHAKRYFVTEKTHRRSASPLPKKALNSKR